MAPDAGFEPATKRLTAAYSTAELIRNIQEALYAFCVRYYNKKDILCQEFLQKISKKMQIKW